MHSIESMTINNVYRKLSKSLKMLLKNPLSLSFVCVSLSLKKTGHVLRLVDFDLVGMIATLLASLLLCPANDGECELSGNVELEAEVEKFDTVSEPETKLGTNETLGLLIKLFDTLADTESKNSKFWSITSDTSSS
jgi:hypothetical protein